MKVLLAMQLASLAFIWIDCLTCLFIFAFIVDVCRNGKSLKFASDYRDISSAASKHGSLSSDRRSNIGSYQDLELRAIDILNSVDQIEGATSKTNVLANLNGNFIFQY